MKKIYFFLVAVLALFGASTAQAKDVVKSIGHHITALSELQQGQKVLFFNNGGPEFHGQAERKAFLLEDSEGKMWIQRNLPVGTLESNAYIWTIETLQENGDAIEITLKSAAGNYFAAFSANNAQGQTGTEPGNLTITQSAEADSLFFIQDANGIYFNGQNTDGYGAENGRAKFVGWNQSGDNSNYMIYIPEIEDKTVYQATFYLNDEAGTEIHESITQSYTVGDSVFAPVIENYTYLSATDGDMNEIELPLVMPENDLELVLTYKKWAQVDVICYGQNGGVLYTNQSYYQQGTQFVLPSEDVVGIGYVLNADDAATYGNYTITEDVLIELHYTYDPTHGLPFVPTTIADGAFADDTHFYTMKIRGGNYIYVTDDSNDVKIGSTIDTDNINNYLWAFTGDLASGVSLYNKAKGATLMAYTADMSDGAQVTLGSSDDIALIEAAVDTFNIIKNGAGFSFVAGSSAAMNHYSSGALLKLWASSWSLTDGGSVITFAEITQEDIDAIKWAPIKNYLGAEGCVGGWTAEQLADLKAAIEAKNLVDAQDAITDLAAQDTIAFDASKTYYLISGFKGFSEKQPGVSYAIYANDNDSVVWNALQPDNDAYKWVFEAVSDTTYLIGNVAKQNAIAGFRFASLGAVLYNGTVEELADGDICAVGEKAPFQLFKSVDTPAAYYIRHNYGASIITLAAKKGVGTGEETSGSIQTYNTSDGQFINAWRLKPAGDIPTSLGNAIEADNAADATIYDLSGRRVVNPAKGLYIQKGKTFIVK